MEKIILSVKSRIIFTLLLAAPILVFILVPIEIINLEMVLYGTTYNLFATYLWIYYVGKIVIKNTQIKVVTIATFKRIMIYIMSFIFIPCLLILTKHFITNFEINLLIGLILLLLTIFYVICAFIIFYLMAKSIVSLDQKSSADSIKIIGVFILFIYFPVTIWFLHGMVSKKIIKN